MFIRYSRYIFWFAILLILATALGFAFWPKAIEVDISTLRKNQLKMVISEEGKTRVHDIYVLSAPITGYLRRLEAEVGDQVNISSTVVAKIEPIDSSLLDPRSQAQAKADIEAAKSFRDLAQAKVTQAEADLAFSLSEFNRIRELRLNQSASQRELDIAQRTYKMSRAELATAQAAHQMRLFELERAKAQLLTPISSQASRGSCECVDIIAPIDGSVLRIIHKSEGVVNAGTPLIEIGNSKDLEIIVELLSFDAVKVIPGQKVIISNWGGPKELEGTVRSIEPIGFKKVSALGIEEQRVNVIVNIDSDVSEWERLGHGYQVDVDIILWEGEDILTIPITALFRENNKWAMFAVVNNVADKRMVEVGIKNDTAAQILSGLKENEQFIVHINEQLDHGVKVVELGK